jgi:hypothetical protein
MGMNEAKEMERKIRHGGEIVKGKRDRRKEKLTRWD